VVMTKKLASFSVTAGMVEVLEAVEDVNTEQFHHPHIITKDEVSPLCTSRCHFSSSP
jgi:hypothetical protein